MDKDDLNQFLPSPEELAEADKNSAVIVLVKGKRKSGQPFYAYVAVPPSKLLAFKEAEKKGNYMLDDYGEILKYGEGEEPSAEVIAEMKEKYNADADFEQKVTGIMKKAIHDAEKDELIKKVTKKNPEENS